MKIAPDVTRAVLQAEVEAVISAASTFGWIVCADLDQATVMVRLRAHNGDVFVVHFDCADYPGMPPAVDFADTMTGSVGGKRIFPKGNDSFFNEHGPCICAPFNRKAYKLPDQPGGLHQDWTLAEWRTSQANNFNWRSFADLKGILTLIQSRLDRKSAYVGRMAA